MPGPLHFPRVLVLYPFRYRHELTGKWVRARYLAERPEIAARYATWEIIGEPEIRRPEAGSSFNHWRSTA
jgi:hypothetical protein